MRQSVREESGVGTINGLVFHLAKRTVAVPMGWLYRTSTTQEQVLMYKKVTLSCGCYTCRKLNVHTAMHQRDTACKLTFLSKLTGSLSGLLRIQSWCSGSLEQEHTVLVLETTGLLPATAG